MDPEEQRIKITKTYARRVELTRKVEQRGTEKNKGVNNDKSYSR
jgi:hypothetical protein